MFEKLEERDLPHHIDAFCHGLIFVVVRCLGNIYAYPLSPGPIFVWTICINYDISLGKLQVVQGGV